MCVWVYQYMANVDFEPTLRTNKPIYTTFTQLLETNTELQATVQITQMLHKQGDYSCLLMSSYIHGSRKEKTIQACNYTCFGSSKYIFCNV